MNTPLHKLPEKWRESADKYEGRNEIWTAEIGVLRSCAAELEAALADQSVKITQIMLTPNDSNWQGMLLGLGEDGVVYRSTCNDDQPWVPFIQARTPPKP